MGRIRRGVVCCSVFWVQLCWPQFVAWRSFWGGRKTMVSAFNPGSWVQACELPTLHPQQISIALLQGWERTPASEPGRVYTMRENLKVNPLAGVDPCRWGWDLPRDSRFTTLPLVFTRSWVKYLLALASCWLFNNYCLLQSHNLLWAVCLVTVGRVHRSFIWSDPDQDWLLIGSV